MNGEKCHVGQKAVFQDNAVVLKIMKVVNVISKIQFIYEISTHNKIISRAKSSFLVQT